MTDRSELIRQYKETPRPAGVYRVLHVPTGTFTLGASVDVPSMLNRIRFELEMGSHRNGALQREWDGGVARDFAFETLDLLEPSDDPAIDMAEELAALEEMWRDRLSSGA